MNKSFTVFSISIITISIILGAIAAHSLEKIVSESLLLSFEKGVKYMMYSGLGLLTISLNSDKFSFNIVWSVRLIAIGTILFSGNIFLYIFHEHVPELKNFVHLVPVGGLLMIIGWSILLFGTIRSSK
ncbi:MAG: DUF423 domain-containing protein [Crocinitomicaceae bacterium]